MENGSEIRRAKNNINGNACKRIVTACECIKESVEINIEKKIINKK